MTVWVPAFPPIEATIGIRTAKATNFSISSWNNPITEEARIAVSILSINHEKRPFTVSINEELIDKSLTPVKPWRSSSASSLITSTISSTIITPRSLFILSITGISTSPYCWNNNATSSWSVWTFTLLGLVAIKSFNLTGLFADNNLDNDITPNNLWAGSTT